ncbi:MAG: flagellar export protein FliJ [Treponema sp.]|jgi:flagellar FliJ protein|nr:flagellar export protein FliJ [Treponema sp.]
MKRFVFDLEKVLNLRKYREQEAKIALGRAVGELADIENRLKELALLRSRAAGEYLPSSGLDVIKQDGPVQFPFSADYYRNYQFYIRRLDLGKEELLEAAAKAQLKLEEKRAAYLEASRERKALDKLKEKRAAEYRRVLFAEETKTLDDIAGRRSGGRRD